MKELQEHLATLGTDKEPPSEGDLLLAAETLRNSATRLAEPQRSSLIRVADFAESVAPTIGVLRLMAENGTLPDLGGMLPS